MNIETEKLIWMYRQMVRHREFENRALAEKEAENIPGFIHFSQGQEAITAGSLAAIRPDDYYTSTHRAQPRQIIRGEKPERLMAELFGKKTGTMKGKGGTIHLTNLPFGDLGTDGILGIQPVIAPGAALSAKLRGTDQVTLCFFGEGVCNTGGFHEGVNLSAVWKLPIVFICENNGFACTTKISDAINLDKLSERARGYGIPGKTIDGNDVIAVYEAVSKAVRHARRGEGPSLIDCETCRWYGHFDKDPHNYRTKEELDECRKRDPIPRFRKKLFDLGVLTDKEADSIQRETREEMEKAVQFARQSDFPDIQELFTDVYA